MPEDPNLEFLSVIHGVQSASLNVQKMFELAISVSQDGKISMPVTAAEAVTALLRVQDKMISQLTETNQEIVDRVESLVARLER